MMKSIDKIIDEFLEVVSTGSIAYFETLPKDPALVVYRKIPKKIKNKKSKNKK